MRSTIAALLLIAACTTDPELGSSEHMGQNLNGQNLNGQNLNGQNLNGQNLNGPDAGTFTIWTSLYGATRNGTSFERVTLAQTQLTGHNASSRFSGREMEGAHMVAMRGDGRQVTFRLTLIVPPAAGDDIWRYYVDYRDTSGLWFPVCKNTTGPIAAIALDGVWDHRQGVAGGGAHVADDTRFTFACEGQGAIGKCVANGYAPWRSLDGTSLWNHHAACVRLLRGDYCGDGTSYTQDGNRVNLFDDLGLQDDTENWLIEAEWDANGARCFYPLNRSRAGIPCYDARVELACGEPSHFDTGALLMNETPSAGILP